MSQDVNVRALKKNYVYGCVAVIERHGRRIYLDADEAKMVREQIGKALKQFNAFNRKTRKK